MTENAEQLRRVAEARAVINYVTSAVITQLELRDAQEGLESRPDDIHELGQEYVAATVSWLFATLQDRNPHLGSAVRDALCAIAGVEPPRAFPQVKVNGEPVKVEAPERGIYIPCGEHPPGVLSLICNLAKGHKGDHEMSTA